MNVEYYKELSHELNRDMEFKVYGHTGIPCLVFPAQNGRFYDFENFGMIDAAHELSLIHILRITSSRELEAGCLRR